MLVSPLLCCVVFFISLALYFTLDEEARTKLKKIKKGTKKAPERGADPSKSFWLVLHPPIAFALVPERCCLAIRSFPARMLTYPCAEAGSLRVSVVLHHISVGVPDNGVGSIVANDSPPFVLWWECPKGQGLIEENKKA